MNIGTLLTSSAASHPANVATVYGPRRMNYEQFNARVNRLANALRRLGLQPRDHVAILMVNCPQMLEVMFAAFKAGYRAVPINWRLHPSEFAYIVENARASALFTTAGFDEQVSRVRGDLPDLKHVITTGSATTDRQVLARHPAVREVAVIGVPDEQWGEAIKAVVSLVTGQHATEEELIAFCKSQIASYKKPKSVDFVTELPKNNYGKIVKRELRDPFWNNRERGI